MPVTSVIYLCFKRIRKVFPAYDKKLRRLATHPLKVSRKTVQNNPVLAISTFLYTTSTSTLLYAQANLEDDQTGQNINLKSVGKEGRLYFLRIFNFSI